MNDLEYRYFYEVAMTLNFSQAAERLFISQPALSRCISNLEEEFHTPLFVRNKRGVHLTSAGVALLHNYPQVQQANRILQETVQNAACGMDSRLVIGIQEGHLITASIKQALKDFRIHNPSIEINVVSLVYNQLFDQPILTKLIWPFPLTFLTTSIQTLSESIWPKNRATRWSVGIIRPQSAKIRRKASKYLTEWTLCWWNGALSPM